MTMSRFSTSAHRRHFSTAGKPQLPHLFAKHLGDATSAAAWTALINDLARAGDSPDALRAFSSMRRLAVKPPVSSFPCSIKACAALAALRPGQQLHLQALALGFAADIFVSASLVDLYSKCGRLDAARRAFLDASSPNVVSWTALIAGYVKNAYPREALLYFKDLLLHCVGADAVAAVAAASACAAAADIESTRGVQCWVVKSGLASDLAVQNVLIEAYAEAGEVELARKVFDGMRERDVVSWNSIFAVYTRNGMSPMAIEAFCAMVRNGGGVHCNAVTLSTLLLACAHTGALQLAKCIHDQV